MDEGGSRNGASLSLKMLTAERLIGGLLYWGPWVMKGRIWGCASLFVGAQSGKLEWVHLQGTFERWLKGALDVGHLPLWELCEGKQEGGFPCRGPWRIGRKRSGDGHLFHSGSTEEPGRGLVYQGL
jgi:hypothetical protein